jgi:hypothetical protein
VRSAQWIEHRLLPGYIISRNNIVLSAYGAKHGAVEPQLGHNEAGELAYWVRPIGHPAMIRIRIEGLRNFFKCED